MKKQAFTLIEILVVISIIGILMGLLLVAYQGTRKTARDGRREADLEQIRSALEMKRSDVGPYPSDGNGSWTNASNLLDDLTVYLSPIPSDPLSSETYQYKATNPQTVSGTTRYYGYNLSANLEQAPSGTLPCTPATDDNFCVKNP